jgi:hypothetical protein
MNPDNYSFAGQTIAMKDSSGFKYFLSDHLGSVSLVLDSNGTILEQQRYLPFGAPRTMPPYASVTSTDFTYTGQRDIPGTGLMDYKARFYSPYINSTGLRGHPETLFCFNHSYTHSLFCAYSMPCTTGLGFDLIDRREIIQHDRLVKSTGVGHGCIHIAMPKQFLDRSHPASHIQ